ncbi:Thioesterase superfamily protein [Hirschfeldia incana]|nr:Thioesterase superfamily protein [Hirschfeldia incana]
MVDPVLKATNYLKELCNAGLEHYPASILQGIQTVYVGKGIVQCKLIITDRVLGEDGTIHTGAVAALMETMGATAIFSAGGSHATVDLNYSLYSTAKKQVKTLFYFVFHKH